MCSSLAINGKFELGAPILSDFGKKESRVERSEFEDILENTDFFSPCFIMFMVVISDSGKSRAWDELHMENADQPLVTHTHETQ